MNIKELAIKTKEKAIDIYVKYEKPIKIVTKVCVGTLSIYGAYLHGYRVGLKDNTIAATTHECAEKAYELAVEQTLNSITLKGPIQYNYKGNNNDSQILEYVFKAEKLS